MSNAVDNRPFRAKATAASSQSRPGTKQSTFDSADIDKNGLRETHHNIKSPASQTNLEAENTSSIDSSSIPHADTPSLTEVAAHKPVQRHIGQQNDATLESNRPFRGYTPNQGYAKDKHFTRNAYEEENGIDEVIAPRPVNGHPNSREWRHAQQSPPEISNIATQIYIVSYLIFFSILGTLARLGTQWLAFYPGAPIVFANLWANFGGTFFMGFLSEDQRVFREEWGRNGPVYGEEKSHDREAHGKTKKTIPLFIGLATGFCGSYTSFSTFMRDAFLALSNGLPTPHNHPNETATLTSTVDRNRGYSFLAILAIFVLTLTVNLGALKLGAHIALALDPVMPTLPFKLVRKVIDRFVVVLAALCWLGAVFMAIWPPDRPSGPSSRGSWSNETWRGEVIFALVFAPLGCLLRYYLAKKLNPIVKSFPLGTFAANMFGTAVLSMAYDIQHAPLGSDNSMVGGGRVGCQVLQGVQDGFDGCLTTVSTWILELTTLKRRHAYFYGFASLSVALSIAVVILGSLKWTIGFSTPACVVTTS